MSPKQLLTAAVLLVLTEACASPAPPGTASPTSPAASTRAPTPSTQSPTPTATQGPSAASATWRRVNSDLLNATQGLDNALSADDAVYAVSSTGNCPDDCAYRVVVTSDGQEWRPMANPIPNADWVNDLAFDDGRYVAVGTANGGAAIWTSLGGLWTQNRQTHIFDLADDGGPGEASNVTAQGAVTITSVAKGPAGWLAVGSASCSSCAAAARSRYAAWSSPDGHTWLRQPFQAGGPVGVSGLVSNGASYGAVNAQGLWFSADGQAWQHVLNADPATGRMVGAAAGNGQYLAAELNQARGVVISASADGQHWNELPASGDLAGAIPAELQYLSGKWALVGEKGIPGAGPQMLWSSDDGVSWSGELVAAEPQAQAMDVGAIGDLPVVVGSFGDQGANGVGAAWVRDQP